MFWGFLAGGGGGQNNIVSCISNGANAPPPPPPEPNDSSRTCIRIRIHVFVFIVKQRNNNLATIPLDTLSIRHDITDVIFLLSPSNGSPLVQRTPVLSSQCVQPHMASWD